MSVESFPRRGELNATHQMTHRMPVATPSSGRRKTAKTAVAASNPSAENVRAGRPRTKAPGADPRIRSTTTLETDLILRSQIGFHGSPDAQCNPVAICLGAARLQAGTGTSRAERDAIPNAKAIAKPRPDDQGENREPTRATSRARTAYRPVSESDRRATTERPGPPRDTQTIVR